MAKRISRRELKEKIKQLTFDLRMEKSKREEVTSERDMLKKRIMDLGSHVEMMDIRGGGIECIEVKPQPWGQYCTLTPGMKPTDDQLEFLKRKLVTDIVNGLMESNNIQIIIHDDWGFITPCMTIGAKLFVVPWDKLVKKLVVKC